MDEEKKIRAVELLENKYKVLNAVDETITCICEKIQEDDFVPGGCGEMIKALALLVTARAFVSNS